MAMRLACGMLTLPIGLAPTSEASLDGDTFVPVHEEAQRDLARGDRALEAARRFDSDKAWTDTLDAWQAALEKTISGDLVPLLVQEEGDEVWTDTDGNFQRRTEDVAVAVLARLARLASSERARWHARFSPLAEDRLLEARSAHALLQDLERKFPATRAASLAALRLADRAFEAGTPQSARAWLERGLLHANLGNELENLGSAYEARQRLLDTLLRENRPSTWKNASQLELAEEVDLRARSFGRPPKGEGFDRGLISGGVFLDDGRFVIQHPLAVFVVAKDGSGPIFEPRKLLEAFPRQSGATFAPSGQAWPLEPATDGNDLFFVLGRAIVAGNTSAVCRLSAPPAIGEAASLGWVLSTHGHADSERQVTPIEEVLEPGTWEFQPGPAVFENRLIVQARQWLPIESGAASAVDTSRPRCWVLALDIETGFPVWTRFLGKGSDVQRDFGTRFGGGQPAAPAQPVAISGAQAFCATGVGLWSLSRSRRRTHRLDFLASATRRRTTRLGTRAPSQFRSNPEHRGSRKDTSRSCGDRRTAIACTGCVLEANSRRPASRTSLLRPFAAPWPCSPVNRTRQSCWAFRVPLARSRNSTLRRAHSLRVCACDEPRSSEAQAWPAPHGSFYAPIARSTSSTARTSCA